MPTSMKINLPTCTRREFEEWWLEMYRLFGVELSKGNEADFSKLRQLLIDAGMTETQVEISMNTMLAYYQRKAAS